MSQYAQRSQYASNATGIAGARFIDAGGNAPGAGTLSLRLVGALKQFQWTPNGGLPGQLVTASADGLLTIPAAGAGEYYIVDVVQAQLPDSDISINPYIDSLSQLILPDSEPGAVEYYCLYIYAIAALTNVVVKLQQTQAGGRVEIGIDPLAENNTAQIIANAQAEPEQVVFDTVDIEIGNMSANGFYPVWLKRTASDTAADAAGNLLVCFD